MNDQQIYRIAGLCSLACIATFFIEFPFYLIRGPFPGLAASSTSLLRAALSHDGQPGLATPVPWPAWPSSPQCLSPALI
jgi:hypothetical protein